MSRLTVVLTERVCIACGNEQAGAVGKTCDVCRSRQTVPLVASVEFTLRAHGWVEVIDHGRALVPA